MTPPTISFIDNHKPPLLDGQYTLELTHHLTYNDGKEENQSFSKTHTFAVCGERFALLPKEIHKVFPPANTQGDYDSVLPHIILTRRTLPWERTPDGATTVGDGKVRSWLALMVFSQSEAPSPATGTLADLYPSTTADGGGALDKDNSGICSYGCLPQPKNTFLQYGQKSTDACVYLDIPQNLFAAYAPSLADLQWNAHARCRTHKDGSADDYAVVVATRLPPAGETVVVHLVSLEGLGDQLPQDDGTFKQPPPQWTAIRLVSLKSWSFRVGPLQESFADVLKGLNGGVQSGSEIRDSQLRLPAEYRPAATPNPNAAPAAPFDSGYTVLAGQDPAKAAWYRGPFVPSTVTPPAADNTWPSTLLPADHATDLDAKVSATPATDQSYSAAWQLGRLIALADKDFAVAQVAWKRDCRLKLNTAIRQANLAAGGSRAGYAQSMRDIINNTCKIQCKLGGSVLTVDSKATDALYIPQALVDWLGKLALLKSVPFHYLVPDANMLPTESIRFFNVDPRWVACLLDGAWSLGREPAKTWAFDAAYRPWSPLFTGTWTDPHYSPPKPVSGVLLNSRLLPGYWPGIDFVRDDDDPGQDIYLLREDRLGPTTLLLLYDQTFKTLTVQEPPEGIHFGFDMDVGEVGNLGKKLRYVSENNAYYPSGSGKTPPPEGTPDEFVGSDVPGPEALTSIPQRTADVIQFDQLADQMQTALGIPITAAEFALQLVEDVPAVKFTLPS